MKPSPPTLLHTFSSDFFRFFFLFFFFIFSSTPNFEARIQCSNFEVRNWKFEVSGSKFHLRTSKMELRTQTSKFNVLLPRRHHHPPSFFSFFFFFFSSTPNFEVGFQSSNFEIRSWNLKVWVRSSTFPLPPPSPPTLLPHFLSLCFLVFFFFLFLSFFFHAKFQSQTSKFQLRTSKLEFRTQT